MDAPECKEFQDKYNQCYSNWFNTSITDMKLTALSECTPQFTDYKDCVEIVMRARVESKKKKSQQSQQEK